MTSAHAVAHTFDAGLQRLAVSALNLHMDRIEARQEAAYKQQERRLGTVGRVARRVREDAEAIETLQAENERLRAELSAMRMRALRAEGRLEDVTGALRTLRDARRVA